MANPQDGRPSHRAQALSQALPGLPIDRPICLRSWMVRVRGRKKGKVPTDKPNILIIWGDDIGWFNVSAYNHGIMGYRTPNIDRLAREGAMFTDWYGQQSCTAGRAAFITGQSPIRTGLTKVGLPGANLGLQPEDPTIAVLLKPLGYTTGQFGEKPSRRP
jgi:arylsulfatase A-like enzyme